MNKVAIELDLLLNRPLNQQINTQQELRRPLRGQKLKFEYKTGIERVRGAFDVLLNDLLDGLLAHLQIYLRHL